jgi:outer membrane protein OmpA-like peptidoglycan-associated protein
MVGSRIGVSFSGGNTSSNSDLSKSILIFEGQVYFRWNFMQLDFLDRTSNLFAQAGLGMLAAYRGKTNPFNDVTETRGSLLADAAVGLTFPITDRLHVEPSIRGGYPHIWGISLTAGYKFPLPEKTVFQEQRRTEYVEVIRRLPPVEVIKELTPQEIVSRIMITAVEYILFGPDIGSYNVGIDADARQLNELVLNETAHLLKENPNFRVRIEGHANPYTINTWEADELMVLGSMRSNNVAEQLRQRGVSDEQMVIISFGGTRIATSEWDVRNRNRRVEMIIIQVNTDE